MGRVQRRKRGGGVRWRARLTAQDEALAEALDGVLRASFDGRPDSTGDVRHMGGSTS